MNSVTVTVPAPAVLHRERKLKTLILSAPVSTGIRISLIMAPATVHSMSQKRLPTANHWKHRFLNDGHHVQSESGSQRFRPYRLRQQDHCNSRYGVVASAAISAP